LIKTVLSYSKEVRDASVAMRLDFEWKREKKWVLWPIHRISVGSLDVKITFANSLSFKDLGLFFQRI
jgi:hypothetical protein